MRMNLKTLPSFATLIVKETMRKKLISKDIARILEAIRTKYVYFIREDNSVLYICPEPHNPLVKQFISLDKFLEGDYYNVNFYPSFDILIKHISEAVTEGVQIYTFDTKEDCQEHLNKLRLAIKLKS